MALLPFLSLTFLISLAGFAVIALVPAAQSPETPLGLPFWLITVWGPSLAAIILSLRSGEFAQLMARAIKIDTVPIAAWVLIVAPLLMLAVLFAFSPGETTRIGFGTIALMIVFNLILGPMGEEFGWRGVMQERLGDRLGWLEASLVVGVVWLVWHLPLWTIDSPHAQIALPLFAAHCLLYAIIIGAAYTMSGGSILPAILLHLTVNLASNLAVFCGYRDANAWFAASAVPYLFLAGVSIFLVHRTTDQIGLKWLLASSP